MDIGYFEMERLTEKIAKRILKSQGYVYESSEPMRMSHNPRAIAAYGLAKEILGMVVIEINKTDNDEEE